LEQFQEIIHTTDDDQKAAKSIGYCMEAAALKKENIYQADKGIDHHKIQENLFGTWGIDDLPEHIKIKGDFDHR
jgi:hypothetical protein